MYFENLDDIADTDRLATMMSHLLTAELERFSGVTMVSQQRIQAALLQRGQLTRNLDRPAAIDLARQMGVESLVIGQATRANGRPALVEMPGTSTGRDAWHQTSTPDQHCPVEMPGTSTGHSSGRYLVDPAFSRESPLEEPKPGTAPHPAAWRGQLQLFGLPALRYWSAGWPAIHHSRRGRRS